MNPNCSSFHASMLTLPVPLIAATATLCCCTAKPASQHASSHIPLRTAQAILPITNLQLRRLCGAPRPRPHLRVQAFGPSRPSLRQAHGLPARPRAHAPQGKCFLSSRADPAYAKLTAFLHARMHALRKASAFVLSCLLVLPTCSGAGPSCKPACARSARQPIWFSVSVLTLPQLTC